MVVGFRIGAGGAVLAVLAAAAAAALATGGILRGGAVAAMPYGGGFAFGLGEELGMAADSPKFGHPNLTSKIRSQTDFGDDMYGPPMSSLLQGIHLQTRSCAGTAACMPSGFDQEQITGLILFDVDILIPLFTVFYSSY